MPYSEPELQHVDVAHNTCIAMSNTIHPVSMDEWWTASSCMQYRIKPVTQHFGTHGVQGLELQKQTQNSSAPIHFTHLIII